MDKIIGAQKTDSTLRPLWHKAETDDGEYFEERGLLWRKSEGVCKKFKCQLVVTTDILDVTGLDHEHEDIRRIIIHMLSNLSKGQEKAY